MRLAIRGLGEFHTVGSDLGIRPRGQASGTTDPRIGSVSSFGGTAYVSGHQMGRAFELFYSRTTTTKTTTAAVAVFAWFSTSRRPVGTDRRFGIWRSAAHGTASGFGGRRDGIYACLCPSSWGHVTSFIGTFEGMGAGRDADDVII